MLCSQQGIFDKIFRVRLDLAAYKARIPYRGEVELLSYTSGPSPLWSPQGLAHIVRALAENLYVSVIKFTTTGYGTTVAVGYTRIVAMAGMVFGVFLTALFAFVLARKVTQ